MSEPQAVAERAEEVAPGLWRWFLADERIGGHESDAYAIASEGGVVLDLSGLKAVEVDPGARTVRVGGGCTWGEVDAATGEHGLATPSGIISTTGVGGLTLGGGLGHLTRKHGLTIDNLLEAEVVLASGEASITPASRRRARRRRARAGRREARRRAAAPRASPRA